ncbi:15005_t:CDS:2 [Cetraspora pellucida]|uniref:15005_t:CDS:1 n=1 Tax=Cetraspora pellucida TaxID=1433469 RepID=A0A9N9GW84_9GLOM|nr:15005_t:CDS:2 [Cetraspora pellucida]
MVSACMRKWFNWCATENHNLIRCLLQTIVEFLDHLYGQNMQFNTIASYRSAISKIHVHVDGKSIGSHPIIVKVMKGLFNLNPPKQSSVEVVDVLPMMDYIQSLGSNTEMSILNLTQKTALLLALTSGSHPSDLHRIDLSTILRTPNGIVVYIRNPKESKISRSHGGKKEQFKKLFIGSYPDDINFSLFLTTTALHKPASIDSIARWIKTCLTVSSESLTAKDTRVISAFLAQNSEADLTTIMALGNWSSNMVYQKFYQRGISLLLQRNNIVQKIIEEALSTPQ